MNGRTTIDGACVLMRAPEDKASLASAMIDCDSASGEGDDISHHAAETGNEARPITAAANSGLRAARHAFGAVFSAGVRRGPRSSSRLAWTATYSDARAASAGGEGGAASRSAKLSSAGAAVEG